MRITKSKMANSERKLLPLPGSKSTIWVFSGSHTKSNLCVKTKTAIIAAYRTYLNTRHLHIVEFDLMPLTVK